MCRKSSCPPHQGNMGMVADTNFYILSGQNSRVYRSKLRSCASENQARHEQSFP